MPPAWLTIVAWTALGVALVCAAWISFDLFFKRHRQQMRVMETVWPITALYFGPVAVWGYRRFGWPKSPRWRNEHGYGNEPPVRPGWSSVATSVAHCGAGCTLGDLVAEWCVFGLGVTIANLALVPEYIGDFVAAVALGIVFQYFAIAPMRGLAFKKGLLEAAKADVLSLTAFEIGLFGWMALTQLVFFSGPHLTPDHAAYWFLMQVGMIVGFFTAWPVNLWLIHQGVKEAM